MANEVVLHEPSAGTQVAPPRGEVTHLTCCKDWGTALCGTDVEHVDVAPDDWPVTCVVCDELDRESPEFCPRRAFCPLQVVPA